MKAILAIADGMADRPVEELGWRTPLEAAHRPSMNRIAETGICGVLDPISPGVPPGSDTGTLALLGYDALKVYTGRGALEALGCGVEVLTGDIAFRCNLATVNKDFVVLDRRAGRIENNDATKLAASLNRIKLKSPETRFLFKNTIQHRAVLVIHGPGLSTDVSGSDPGDAGKKAAEVKPLNNSPASKLTAKIVNGLLHEFHEALKCHRVNANREKHGLPPANMVLCRGVGTTPNVKPLSQQYDIEAACVAATPLVRGVCKVVGMRVVDVKGATGTPKTDYVTKARAVVQALKSCDLVLLHVKATDVASHDKKPQQKICIIEKVDQMLGYLLENVDLDSTYLAVTADHTTSVVTGHHEGDPVPVVITGPYVRRDEVKEYGERSCASGGLGRIRGLDLMPILMDLIGKRSQFGA